MHHRRELTIRLFGEGILWRESMSYLRPFPIAEADIGSVVNPFLQNS